MRTAPLTARTWPDLQTLFGPNGAIAGCWCMWWRVPSKQWSSNGSQRNKAAFEDVACSGRPTGLIAYEGKQPVGWVAIAPRTEYPRLLRSRTLKLDPADDSPALWSVTCFFIHRDHRGTGVATRLLKDAMPYAKRHGARLLEAYASNASGGKRPSGELFTGTVSLFAAAGFTEYGTATGSRTVMRHAIG
jgi:GNAT superfamily N-acetyltransferase